MPKKKRKRKIKRNQGKRNLDVLFSNIFLGGLILIIGGFIWSFVSNLDDTDKIQIDTRQNLPDLIQRAKYEIETGHRIKIEVLNGCGIRGLAAMYTDFLRSVGMDVMSSENADNFRYSNTQVISRFTDIERAKVVSKFLGLDESQIIDAPDTGMYLDATVIIGSDYDQLESFERAIKFKVPF